MVGVPLLTVIADLPGSFGGWVVAVKLFGVIEHLFWEKMKAVR